MSKTKLIRVPAHLEEAVKAAVKKHLSESDNTTKSKALIDDMHSQNSAFLQFYVIPSIKDEDNAPSYGLLTDIVKATFPKTIAAGVGAGKLVDLLSEDEFVSVIEKDVYEIVGEGPDFDRTTAIGKLNSLLS